MSFIPIKSEKYWDVPFTGINVTPAHNLTVNTNLTVVDTGTTLTYGPEESINAFYAGVEGAVRGENVNNFTLAGIWLIRTSSHRSPFPIIRSIGISSNPPSHSLQYRSKSRIYSGQCHHHNTGCVGPATSDRLSNIQKCRRRPEHNILRWWVGPLAASRPAIPLGVRPNSSQGRVHRLPKGSCRGSCERWVRQTERGGLCGERYGYPWVGWERD